MTLEKKAANTITVNIRRGTPDKNDLVAYQVPYENGRSVLGVLQYIYTRVDPSLRFTCSCRVGLCTACLVLVNSKVARACTTLVEGDITVEPYKENAFVIDLVTNLPAIIPKSDSGFVHLKD